LDQKTNEQVNAKVNELTIEKVNELKIELKIENVNELKIEPRIEKRDEPRIEKLNEQAIEKINEQTNQRRDEPVIELTMEPRIEKTYELTRERTNNQLKLEKINEMTIARSKEKTNVSDGIIILSVIWVILVVICIVIVKPDRSNYTMLYSFMKAASISTFLAAIIYASLVKMLHYDTKKKIVTLALLFILVNASAFFIGRYIYRNTIKIALSPIEESYSPQIQAELKKINDRINELSPMLSQDPENKTQVYECIAMIDEMRELQKQAFDINNNFHNNISLGFTKEPVLKPAELKGLLKERLNINSDVLPEFREKYLNWFKSLNACFDAKKSSYQSYRDGEPDYKLDIKIRWADGFCATSGQNKTDMSEAQLRFMGAKP
jgi:hypothetical protein